MPHLFRNVEHGQYFITKDAEEFSQFDGHVACREYTLPRDNESSKPNGWIRGSTKIGLVLEVATSYHQRKHGVEIRIDSVSGDGSHSWIRISNGLNKIVRDLTEKARPVKKSRTLQPVRGNPLLNRDRNKYPLDCHLQFLRLQRFTTENGSISNLGNRIQKVMKLQRR